MLNHVSVRCHDYGNNFGVLFNVNICLHFRHLQVLDALLGMC
jgi:hypothetical protein